MATKKTDTSETTKTEKTQSSPASEAKLKALGLAQEQINKQFGDGAIRRLGDTSTVDVELISSGALSLDLALGGGYPKGRIVEIYGPESSGKTTLTLHAIAEIQKKGGTAAFVDAEHALDPAYARRLGVDTDNLLVAQPDNGEQALESLKRSCVRMRLTSWSWTLLQPSCRKQKLKVKWAIATWVFRPAL